MAADFYIKSGDTSPDLVTTLLDADGAAVNLTGATVRFLMRPRGETELTVDGTAVIDDDETSGIVSYQWAEADPLYDIVGDTTTAGDYDAEFEVTFADGSVQTFPNSRYLRIKILRQLG